AARYRRKRGLNVVFLQQIGILSKGFHVIIEKDEKTAQCLGGQAVFHIQVGINLIYILYTL
ncbi:hypothetical protein, partial [Bacillus pseudomycoides]|uniref:hypothetical protein n=1 Tax=Bacillus pseudomycoides TaxID=64104 RepID=UPI00195513E7